MIQDSIQSEIACLIGHPALYEGELCEPTHGYEYLGFDERGLPVAMHDMEDGEIHLIESHLSF